MRKKWIRAIASVLMAVCLTLPLFKTPAFAETYQAGSVIATLDEMFSEDATKNDKILIKPVTKLLDFNVIKVLDRFDGESYSSNYSGALFQKAGVNSLPYAGINFSAPNQCAGVMITAPVDGSYRLTGHFNRKHESTDGSVFTKSWIYAYVNENQDFIYSEKFWHTEKGVACDETFNMNAGDKLYVFSDPNGGEHGWWEDFCYFMDLKLELKSTKKSQTDTKEYKAGDTVAGIDAVFERDMNYEGSLIVPVVKFFAFNNAIKPMKYNAGDGSYSESSCTLFKEGTNGEPYAGTNFGVGNIAVGFKFTAPADADYTLKGRFNRKHDSKDESVFTPSYVYAYIDGQESNPVFSEKFWKSPDDIICNKTFHMKKGQILYVFSDPNGGDNAWWEDCCYIKELSLTVGGSAQSDTDSATETADGETTEVQTQDTDTAVTSDTIQGNETVAQTDRDSGTEESTDTEKKSTDDKGAGVLLTVVIGAVVLVAAVITFILVKKKKS